MIEPVSDDDPFSEIQQVHIRVSPKGGRDHPTMPLFPDGMIYQDRLGVKYTILSGVMMEIGTSDGESSIWVHDYLAAFGAHRLIGMPT
jgi:hypothetical protein